MRTFNRPGWVVEIGAQGPLKNFKFVDQTTAIFVIGQALVVLAFLGGPPYRLDQFDLPKEFVFGLLGVVCAIKLLCKRLAQDDRHIDLLLFAFLVWGTILIPAVAVNEFSAWRVLGIFSAASCVFVLARIGTSPHDAEWIYWSILIVIWLLCLTVLLEAFGLVPFFSAPGRRPGAMVGNRNLAARLTALSLPLVWYQLSLVRRISTRWILLAILATATAVIVVSRSRGALLVSCISVVMLPLASRWRATGDFRASWNSTTISWVTAIAVGTTLAIVIPNRLGWCAADFSDSARRLADYTSGTGRGRIIQAQTSWQMIRRYPLLGVGPGSWSVLYPAFALPADPSVEAGAFYPGPQIPRNDYLTIAAEWGLAGTGIGVAALVTLFASASRLFARGNQESRSAGLLVLGVMLTAMLLGAFDSIVRVAPTVSFVALVTGLGLSNRTNASVSTGLQITALKKALLAALSLVCLAASFGLAASARQDIRALRLVNSFSSVADLDRAVYVAPNNVEARALLSFILIRAGRCDLATPHVRRAAELQPLSLLIVGFQKQCGLMRLRPARIP